MSVIVGYPIVFNSLSLPLGPGFREQIDRRAIDRTFREKIDVRALMGHDMGRPIGRLSVGTLALRVDSTGLLAVVDVPSEISWGADLLASRARGDQRGWSFGFVTHKDEWAFHDDLPQRTVTDMTVHEVSTCVTPAYPATEAASAHRSTVAYERGSATRDALGSVLKILRTLWREYPQAEYQVSYRDDGSPNIHCTSLTHRERTQRQMRWNIMRQRLAESTL
jgi:uncharacterized protein